MSEPSAVDVLPLTPARIADVAALFERAGFTVVERRQWNATTPVRPIVRRAL